MGQIEKSKGQIGGINRTNVNIKGTNVTTGQIEIAAPVLKILHFWGDDLPFIPAIFIPAIVVPEGLEWKGGRGGYGRGNQNPKPHPTQPNSKPSRLRRCAQRKSPLKPWAKERAPDGRNPRQDRQVRHKYPGPPEVRWDGRKKLENS